MATTFIKIGTSTPLAGRLQTLVRNMQSVRSDARLLKGIMDTLVNGADYSMLATEFGLSDPTQAQALYNMVVGVTATIEAPDFNWKGLTEKLG